MSRGERRYRTSHICIRRFKVWCRDNNSVPDWSPHYYAKIGPYHCDCRSKIKGRPKVGRGICWNATATIRIVHWRQARRELRGLVRRGVQDWDADSVVLVSAPLVAGE